MFRRGVLILLAVVVIAATTVSYLIFGEVRVAGPVPASLVVKKGANVHQIADDLGRQGLIRSKALFRLLARWGNVDRRILPGRYDFAGPVTMYRILRNLYEQKRMMVKLIFPEGWRVRKFARLLEERVGVPADGIIALCRDTELLAKWQIPAGTAEGYLMPAAYEFYWGIEPADVLDELISGTQKIFDDSLRARMAETGWNEHQVLTMASLIEAEIMRAEERPRVSAVFHNRLKLGMKLQCDPTVIYALGWPGRPLLYRDLKYDSPYNTYLYPGLPPGPICNPGKSAILAALYPTLSDELYFVARGDGTHVFSKTLDEHNRARKYVKRLRGQS